MQDNEEDIQGHRHGNRIIRTWWQEKE